MYKRISRLFLVYCFFIYVCIVFSSCLSLKQIKLFQDIPDSTKLSSIKLPPFVPATVHIGDILSISIITADPTATTSVNLANEFTPYTAISTSGSAGAGPNAGGYLVDKQGNIEMPEIGKIYVAGLTMDEVQDVVRKRAAEYFKDAVVLVKSKSLKLTILGEVTRPGTYNVSNEKFTVIDFLAYSGDFTSFARRDNILLLRQNDDNTYSTIRLDVKSSTLLKSPYYYLQNNDVLYIEPTQGKAYSQDVVFTRDVSYISLAFGLLTTLFVLIKR